MIHPIDGILTILASVKEVHRTVEAMCLVALLMSTSNPFAIVQMAMTALAARWSRRAQNGRRAPRRRPAGRPRLGTPRRDATAARTPPTKWALGAAALLLCLLALCAPRQDTAEPAVLAQSMQRVAQRAEQALPVLDSDAAQQLGLVLGYWRSARATGNAAAQLAQLASMQHLLDQQSAERPARAKALLELEARLRQDAGCTETVAAAAVPQLDTRSRSLLTQLRAAAGTKDHKAARIADLLADRARSYALPLPLRMGGPVVDGPLGTPPIGSPAAAPRPAVPFDSPPTASAPAPLDPRPRDLTPTDGAWSKDAGTVGLAGAALPLPPTDPALVAPVLDTNALAALELPIVASLAANAPIDGRLVVAALVREPQATALLCFAYDPELAGDGDGGGVVGAPVRLAVLATGTKVTLRGVAARAGAVVGEVADGSAQTTTVWPFDGRAPVRVDGHCLGAFDGGTFVGLVQQIADGSRRWLVLPLDGSTPVDQPIELDAAAIAALLGAPSAAPTPTP